MVEIINKIKIVLNYKEMLKNLISKELNGRYKASFLGFFWSLMNPILMTVVYTLVFSTIMKMNVPKFPIFFMANILPWNFFQMSLSTSSMCIVNNAVLVKKIYFPREILPIAITLSNFINYLLSLIIFFIAAFLFKSTITISLIAMPIVFIVQLVLTLGFSFIVSSLTVYFRDIEHMLGIILYLWFYVTPIIYPLTMVPKKYLFLFEYNPMTPIIKSYNDILYRGTWPQFDKLGYVFIFSVVIFVVGYKIFLNKQAYFAEEV